MEWDRNPISGPVSDVANFLADLFQEGYRYRSINVYRSSISSTHDKIDGFSVGRPTKSHALGVWHTHFYTISSSHAYSPQSPAFLPKGTQTHNQLQCVCIGSWFNLSELVYVWKGLPKAMYKLLSHQYNLISKPLNFSLASFPLHLLVYKHVIACVIGSI